MAKGLGVDSFRLDHGAANPREYLGHTQDTRPEGQRLGWLGHDRDQSPAKTGASDQAVPGNPVCGIDPGRAKASPAHAMTEV